MVCGFGDSVSYETLVAKLTGQRLDKSSRFSDWSHRPLTDRQLAYALADVVPLCRIYEVMEKKLETTGRRAWLAEEWAVLTDPATYRPDPEAAWRRLKPKTTKPKTLAILAELAAWREIEAQRRDVPRQLPRYAASAAGGRSALLGARAAHSSARRPRPARVSRRG